MVAVSLKKKKKKKKKKKNIIFFFFKQKTAYEMCDSDWSSDVCSSDLVGVEEFDLEALTGLPDSVVFRGHRSRLRRWAVRRPGGRSAPIRPTGRA